MKEAPELTHEIGEWEQRKEKQRWKYKSVSFEGCIDQKDSSWSLNRSYIRGRLAFYFNFSFVSR